MKTPTWPARPLCGPQLMLRKRRSHAREPYHSAFVEHRFQKNALGQFARRVATQATMILGLALVSFGCLSFHQGPPPGTPSHGQFDTVMGEQIRYVDIMPKSSLPNAKPPTVVMIHGFGSMLDSWFQVVPVLSQAGYRVIAMDLLGHGWSSRSDADYSIDAQAQRVLSLVNQRGVDRFAVVGHSWGSAVAMKTAIAEPERVTHIALFAGMLFEDQKPLVFSWAKVPGLGELIYGVFYPERQDEKLAMTFYDPDKHITEELVEATDTTLHWPGTLAAALQSVRAMRYDELETRYATVKQPVLLLWGREDVVTPVVYGERMLRSVPNGRLIVYPGCGHMPMLEASGPSAHDLVRFLNDRPRDQLPSPPKPEVAEPAEGGAS